MISEENADISSTPRYTKLKIYAYKLSEGQSRSESNKSLKKILNDAAKKKIADSGKKEILVGILKVNTLMPKMLQGRLNDGIFSLGLAEDALYYLLNKIFLSDYKVAESSELEQIVIEYFIAQYGHKYRKPHLFQVSFNDIVDLMRSIIDEL